ncbi:hypothetical protein HQ841_14915, partial [Enterococcus faecium]|nr:hypothetical protein [Enterococcus faecium]
MTEKARDLFDKLMTQIQLDDTAKEHPLIQNGRIDKVIVHQQSRLWEFHLSFDELMP